MQIRERVPCDLYSDLIRPTLKSLATTGPPPTDATRQRQRATGQARYTQALFYRSCRERSPNTKNQWKTFLSIILVLTSKAVLYLSTSEHIPRPVFRVSFTLHHDYMGYKYGNVFYIWERASVWFQYYAKGYYEKLSSNNPYDPPSPQPCP